MTTNTSRRQPHSLDSAEMTQPMRKKLIEVAVPLDAINHGCEEDKDKKTGHIRNLHKWFAPMPLPSWRAMLFAAIVDDPGDCTREMGSSARERARLLKLVERLSAFDSYKDRSLIEEARAEIRKSLGDNSAVIVDPFCGGGSTIIEAQRLGLATQASDLNPIPVLITTVLCRVPSLFGNRSPVNPECGPEPIGWWPELTGLKADIRYYAQRIRARAWEKLQTFYPLHDGAIPYAYRWAWTVASPNPSAQGAYTPLVSDWWLSRHRTSRAWIEPVPRGTEFGYEIHRSGEAAKGTTGRSGANCLWTKTAIPLDYIRSEGRAGRLRPSLIAIAARHGAATIFSAPSQDQLAAAVNTAEANVIGIEMPEAALGFRVQQYGIQSFLGLFSRRQAFALGIFAEEVAAIRDEVFTAALRAGVVDEPGGLEDGGTGANAYADAVTAVLGLCVGKMAQSNNILVRWFIDPRNGSGKATPAFDRHAVPMVWDFVETNPFGGSVGDWTGPVLETALKAFDLCVTDGPPATVKQCDARLVGSNLSQGAMIATDPPYYANIGYADLSDFFYQWIRPSLRNVFPRLLGTVATPKADELIATPFRHNGSNEQANRYFRSGFGDVFGSLGAGADQRFPMLIVYALKQAEDSEEAIRSTGWEVFLGGLIDAGLLISATWPVRTTTDTRMIGLGNNALASAIFVIARRRLSSASKISRAHFLRELRSQVPAAYNKLIEVNIAPVDLAQAAIGPGMEIFSRHAGVLETDGSEMSVGTALGLINQVLDEALTSQESDFDAESRWALAWFEQSGFTDNEYGVAEILSKAKNISISGMIEAGIVVSKAGKARLLRPNELPANWDPATDPRLTAWEVVHQLIRALEAGGEGAAATLVAKLGAKAEIARELAYRLYTICERKKRAAEALSYNGLVQSWPEITRLARESRPVQSAQATLFAEE